MVLWIILVAFSFQLQGYYLLWRSFPTLFIYDIASMLYVRNPNEVNFIGLACSAFARRYLRNRISFSSSRYLDVSVPRVPPAWLCIHHAVTEVLSAGLPHSDICGSLDICSLPQLFAACHVFLRLLVPRHPPCALLCLTFLWSDSSLYLLLRDIALSLRSYGFTSRYCFRNGFFLHSGCLFFNVQFSRYVDSSLSVRWR